MNKDTRIKVRNRSTGSVGYTIPDMGNYPRHFEPNEIKALPYEELQKLSYLGGGLYLLKHYLVIEDLEAREELLGWTEMEYSYTEDDIKNLLLNGSYDELLDCLDFAPVGVIELVQKIAVELKLNDIRKREAIQKATGFNINTAVAANEATDETQPKRVVERRVSSITENKPTEPTRRTVIKKQ